MTLTELYRIAAQIDAASHEAAEDGQLAHAHALHEIAERIRRDAEAGERNSAVEIARTAAQAIGGR
jgi:hypothetical protein